MAGHSKWANIKHRKGAQDAKRGKVFTRLSKEITVVARDKGGDPAMNPRLRTLLEKARHANMPLENVTRAIKKGTGELPGVSYEAHTYEGYGPNGIAVIVEVLTDNKNRAVASVRHAFSSKGGNLGESGSVSWMFSKMGVVKVEKGTKTEDDMLELLIEHEIHNINEGDDVFFVTCEMSDMDKIKKHLEQEEMVVKEAELEWVPNTTTELEDEAAEKAIDFLHHLEELEDIQNVYTNLG